MVVKIRCLTYEQIACDQAMIEAKQLTSVKPGTEMNRNKCCKYSSRQAKKTRQTVKRLKNTSCLWLSPQSLLPWKQHALPAPKNNSIAV